MVDSANYWDRRQEPPGEHGDLWMCDECRAVWMVTAEYFGGGIYFKDWRRVFWRAAWYRRKYGERR